MSTEMINFDELAEDTKFSLKGKVYTIPAISNEKAMALFKMGRDKVKVKDGNIDTADLAQKAEMDNEDFVSFQAQFIAASVLNENGNYVTEVEVAQWPMKVSMAVVKLINKCISGIEDNSAEEKKS